MVDAGFTGGIFNETEWGGARSIGSTPTARC